MAALEVLAAPSYDLAALSATDEGAASYAGRGWLRWQGPTSALTPGGVVRTEGDDDAVFGRDLDRTVELTCDWRDGDLW